MSAPGSAHVGGDSDEVRRRRVERMHAGAQRRRDRIAHAAAALERALEPYRDAAAELLALMESGPKDAEYAARRRMWNAYPPVAAARRELSAAEATAETRRR